VVYLTGNSKGHLLGGTGSQEPSKITQPVGQELHRAGPSSPVPEQSDQNKPGDGSWDQTIRQVCDDNAGLRLKLGSLSTGLVITRQVEGQATKSGHR